MNDVYPQIGSAPRIIRSCCQAGQHLVPSTRPALVDAGRHVGQAQVDSNRTSRQLLEHSYRFCRRTWGQPNDRRICTSKTEQKDISSHCRATCRVARTGDRAWQIDNTLGNKRPAFTAAIAFSNSSLPIAAKSRATQSSSRFISSTPLVQLFQKARSIFLNDFLLRIREPMSEIATIDQTPRRSIIPASTMFHRLQRTLLQTKRYRSQHPCLAAKETTDYSSNKTTREQRNPIELVGK